MLGFGFGAGDSLDLTIPAARPLTILLSDFLSVTEQNSEAHGQLVKTVGIEIICKCYKESCLYKLIVCHLIGKVIKQCPRRSQVQPTEGTFNRLGNQNPD